MFRFAGRAMVFGVTVGVLVMGRPVSAAKIHRGPSPPETESTTPVVVTSTDRVRIQTVADPDRVPEVLRGRFVGSVVGSNQRSLTLVLPDGQPTVVHRDLVEEFELGSYHGSRTKHALVGGLITGLFGVAVGLATMDNDSWISGGETVALGAILFTPIGLLIGAVLPAGQHWHAVPVERVEWSAEHASRYE